MEKWMALTTMTRKSRQSGLHIELCSEDAIEDVMIFIDAYWGKNHILSTSHELMRWQYRNSRRPGYNWVVAKNDEGVILGILGFIPNYHYDSSITGDAVFLWLAVWQVRDDLAPKNLGVTLIYALMKLENTTKIGTIGNNNAVVSLYTALQFNVGKLDRFIFLNPRSDSPVLFSGHVAPRLPPVAENAGFELRRVTEDSFSELLQQAAEFQVVIHPLKTKQYFIERYWRHPFYHYTMLAVIQKGRSRTIFVCRAVEHQGRRALRIVDCIGDTVGLAGLHPLLESLLAEEQAEFMDIYCFGVPHSDLTDAGFLPCPAEGPLVAANYFEPFVLQNIEINYAYKDDLTQYRIFKGDGDQDRPNRL